MYLFVKMVHGPKKAKRHRLLDNRHNGYAISRIYLKSLSLFVCISWRRSNISFVATQPWFSRKQSTTDSFLLVQNYDVKKLTEIVFCGMFSAMKNL